MDRICLDCGNILRGRSDKKFCDDQCRNNYNNQLKSKESSSVKHVNLVLKKNRSILQKLNPSGKVRVRREKLINLGFSFTYHTHTFRTYRGSLYHFCYEYGYLELEKEEYLLVKNEEALR